MTPLKNNMFPMLILLIGLFLTPQNMKAEETAAFSKNFADWLYSRGDLEEAEREYLKYIFITPSVEAPVLFNLSRMYLLQEKEEKIFHLLSPYYASHNSDPFSDTKTPEEIQALDFLYGFSLLKMGTQDASERFSSFTERVFLSGYTSAAMQDLQVFHAILETDYLGAQKTLLADERDPLFLLRQTLKKDLSLYSYKNPLTASLLSALIPGLGKLYTKQYSDAVFSFISVGCLAAVTAYTFSTEDPSSWKPWVYGASGAVFYSANIYGSWVSADRYNQAAQRTFEQSIHEILLHHVP